MAVIAKTSITGSNFEDLEVGLAALPRVAVVPTALGAAKSEWVVDADLATATDQPILYLRVVLDASDDVTAANALLTGVGALHVLPGTEKTFTLNAGATRCYMIAVGSAAIPADYTGGAGVISINETDVTDALAQMFFFDIDSRDEVRTVRIGMTPTYNSGLSAVIYVEAFSHV